MGLARPRADHPMTRLKALSILQARTYTRQLYGAGIEERVKAALSDEVRQVLYSDQLLPGDWIEVAAGLEQVMVFDRVVGTGDGEIAKKLVRDVAQRHFKGLYRVLFMVASPESVLEKGSRLWTRYYDRGESSLVIHEPGHATSRIHGCPDLPLGHEVLVTPYQEELLRQCGAKQPSAVHRLCVAKGSEFCETEIRWKPG
jgi:hypothetical protein